MRAPAFWYQPTGFVALVLLPFSWLYRLGGWLRAARAVPYISPLPTICVGNIVAGGAGKTPVALALAALLQQAGHRPVFVTRGYGGSEAGPLQVATNHAAAAVGDEALLLAQAAPVIIGRDRAAALRLAETLRPSHVILDDGLQNPHVRARLNLLVIDQAGFGNGCVIPAGPLRETPAAAVRRVDAVIVIGDGTSLSINRPVLTAQLLPQLPDDFPRDQSFLAFAGIGRPAKFFNTARQAGLTIIERESFPDHHPFTSTELVALIERASELNATLLTTAKDFVRLPAEARMQVAVLPVRLVFDDEAAVVQLLSTLAPTAPS